MNSHAASFPPFSRILHVVQSGVDDKGSHEAPYRSISAAAQVAQPGDTIRVHEGIYRERIDPPRGGRSDSERITYEAAPGENVEIRGSEVVSGWERQPDGIWRVEISHQLFGEYNPFAELIRGDWFLNMGRPHHTAAVYINGQVLHESAMLDGLQGNFWYAEVASEFTTVWVNVPKRDINEQTVEVNVRPTLFYPSQTGIHYITVQGFVMRHAATQWAPPTAEQVGLIGTNWSKGWVIKENTISHSRCVGVSLGKYGDAFDNTSANSAEGYDGTIERALERGWNREIVGSHIVHRNVISHCEQAGIIGSLGAIFCEITDNVIHDIHVHRLFDGAEQAAIKLHAPIDTLIAGNHIFRATRGIWMDWMAQGTRITRNLCHDNIEQDLFMEMNHGPFVVDHNIFLSEMSLWSISNGGAYVHNLFGGRLIRFAEHGRATPWQEAHSTLLAGAELVRTGDDRFANNLFVRSSAITAAKGRIEEIWSEGMNADQNLDPYENFLTHNVLLPFVPELQEEDDGFHLEMGASSPAWPVCPEVTTDSLGLTTLAQLPYQHVDGSPLVFSEDYGGNARTAENCVAGPWVASENTSRMKVFENRQGSVKSEKIMVV
ncbi:right-handed parallel beta-helix repeat-containing protein [Kiritimatiellota bacterium B12222]|nr:right-handed parallel beta-helix repeat-containing protein [Kiritimatiellota bacterium B12222]